MPLALSSHGLLLHLMNVSRRANRIGKSSSVVSVGFSKSITTSGERSVSSSSRKSEEKAQQARQAKQARQEKQAKQQRERAGHKMPTNTQGGKVLKSAIAYREPVHDNAARMILDGLDRHKNETIIIHSGSDRRWTGAELRRSVLQVALFLIKECQMARGDICNLCHIDDDRTCIIILAVTLAGGTINYLNYLSTSREIHDVLNTLKSKIFIGDHDTLIRLQPHVTDLEKSVRFVSVDEPVGKGLFTQQCLTMDRLFRKEAPSTGELLAISDTVQARINDVQPEDYGNIQFSSGTTGKPKPIPRTHRNLVHLVASVNHPQLMDLRPGVIISGAFPLTHRPGLWALLASVHCGNTLVLWSDLSHVESALASIAKYRVTLFASTLPFFSKLASCSEQLASKYDLTCWKELITAGAKIVNGKMPKRVLAQFKLDSIRQCFGMTESGWVCLIEKSLAKDNYLSVGHVCPGIEARVVERDTGATLEPMCKGELALRGPQLFPGYMTAERGQLNRADFDEEGWFRTGDEAYYDADELVFIEGRFKELLIFANDERWFPTEIEALICEHPAVEAACVVNAETLASDYAFSKAKACITVKDGATVSENELLEFLAERSASIELKGGLEILEEFPRLANGKIDKQTLAKSIEA